MENRRLIRRFARKIVNMRISVWEVCEACRVLNKNISLLSQHGGLCDVEQTVYCSIQYAQLYTIILNTGCVYRFCAHCLTHRLSFERQNHTIGYANNRR